MITNTWLNPTKPRTTCKKVEANNEYTGSDYDSSKASSCINFLDAQNFYGLSVITKIAI